MPNLQKENKNNGQEKSTLKFFSLIKSTCVKHRVESNIKLLGWPTLELKIKQRKISKVRRNFKLFW